MKRVLTAAVLLAALQTGGCIIQLDLSDRAYRCGPGEGECVDGWECFYGSNGDFCAPLCADGCGEGRTCSEQDLCLNLCDTTADCPDGLSCVLTGSGGFCSTSYPCTSDGDCLAGADGIDFTPGPDSFCSSAIDGLGNSCIFTCLDASECPDGYDCSYYAVGISDTMSGMDTGICTLPCSGANACPPGHICTEAPGLPWDAQCVPGLPPLECNGETGCLAGECLTVGDTDSALCTSECTTDADCDALEFSSTGDLACIPSSTGPSVCANPLQPCEGTLCNLFELEVCAQTFFAPAVRPDCVRFCLPGTEIDCGVASGECLAINPFFPSAGGVCLDPCTTAAECTQTGWGCLIQFLNPLGNHCFPGVPFVNCDDESDCVDLADCTPGVQVGVLDVRDVCMVPCTTDAQCDMLDAPALDIDYACIFEHPVGSGSMFCRAM